MSKRLERAVKKRGRSAASRYTDGEFRTRTVECAGGLQLRVGPRKSKSESKQAWRFVRGSRHGFWRSLVNEYVGPRPFRG